MIEEILDIPTADGPMAVITKRPETDAPLPVVLLFHDGPGIRAATHETVHRIAKSGYYVLAPDRYHRFGQFIHVPPEDLIAAGRDSTLMRDFFQMVTATTDDLVRTDVTALLDHLAADPAAKQSSMGCIGYCNGARAVLQTMSDHADIFTAGAGLHPSFCVSPEANSPHKTVANAKGEFYFAIGKADHIASAEHNQPLIDELQKLGPRATVDILPNADHGFAVPGPTYHAPAATHAHRKALTLFNRTLNPA
ncbi:dienelactone hydrolase family protein [Nocardia sp. CA-128927]|uniref:dienelactone hydrolase family protein n=1 Tax=Nocardia sp. CA-128927 TaxID=3239975 RepID=UPI003D985D28